MPAKLGSDPKLKVEEVEEVPETTTTAKPAPVVTEIPKEAEKPVTSFKFADVKEETPIEAVTEKPVTVAPTEASKMEKSDDQKTEDWLKDVKPVDTPPAKGSTGKNILLVLIVLIILGGLVGGGIYYYQNTLNKPQEEVEITTPQPTVVPQETTPTPEASGNASLSDLKVHILNGSGKSGEAGKVSDLIVKGGFTEDNITTGNASSYDYKDTEVAVKADTPKSVFEKIKELLKGSYTAVESETELKDSSSYDVEIIVGSSK